MTTHSTLNPSPFGGMLTAEYNSAVNDLIFGSDIDRKNSLTGLISTGIFVIDLDDSGFLTFAMSQN